MVILRKVLTCAIGTIGLVALLSVHLHIFSFSRVPDFAADQKLPTLSQVNIILCWFDLIYDLYCWSLWF